MASAAVYMPDPAKDLKKHVKADWKARVLTPKNIFIAVGSVMLLVLSIVPIWNSIFLLRDSNYVFWAGRGVAEAIIATCVSIVILYIFVVGMLFRKVHAALRIESSIMIIGNIFITVFGIFLMLASGMLTHQAELTRTNLLYRCDTSEQTHRLYEYSQVLHNIRASPECANKFSVEECKGYQESPPYTSILKGMETGFRCAGFCMDAPMSVAPPPVYTVQPSPDLATAQAPPGIRQNLRQPTLATDALPTDALSQDVGLHAVPGFAPTLFSDANFKATCEGMAAREMKNFAGSFGQQMFMQGIYMIIISIIVGFLNLVSFCIPKP